MNTTPLTKAITLHQPWASLIALGHKSIETRPSPPNGPMCPAGVRGYPGLAIERGERLAIHAGAQRPYTDDYEDGHDFGTLYRGPDAAWSFQWMKPVGKRGWHYYVNGEEPHDLPLGAIVATAVVADALPMVDPFAHPGPDPWDGRDRIFVGSRDGLLRTNPRGGPPLNIDRETDLGDYRPGRWGWLLSDVQRCEPVPCKGRQGVWALPVEASQAVTPHG